MNPTLILLCASLQVAILFVSAPWLAGAGFAIPVVAVLAMLAYTRERWDPHVDMVLLMAAPGGLGMLFAMALPELGWGPACHVQSTWSGYGVMTAGMLLCSVPLSWQSARCLRQARDNGFGGRALLLDLAGMQVGMTLAHLPATLLPMGDPRTVWMHHALMLVGMLLGMFAGMFAWRWLPRPAALAGPHPV